MDDGIVSDLDSGGGWRPVCICQNPHTSTVKKKNEFYSMFYNLITIKNGTSSDFNIITLTLFWSVLV